jgi:adenylate kinase family enzyme
VKAILLLGPSCCGKKKIGTALSRHFRLSEKNYLEMGELLRSLLNSRKQTDFDSFFQRIYGFSPFEKVEFLVLQDQVLRDRYFLLKGKASEYFKKQSNEISLIEWIEFCVKTGQLVPNFVTYGCIQTGLEELNKETDSYLIVDGYPRTIEAAQDLFKKFEMFQIDFLKCFHLFIPPQEMLKRGQTRQRLDDDQKALKDRYQFYLDSVLPTIDWMKVNFGSRRVSLIDAANPDLTAVDSIKKTISVCLKILKFLK